MRIGSLVLAVLLFQTVVYAQQPAPQKAFYIEAITLTQAGSMFDWSVVEGVVEAEKFNAKTAGQKYQIDLIKTEMTAGGKTRGFDSSESGLMRVATNTVLQAVSEIIRAQNVGHGFSVESITISLEGKLLTWVAGIDGNTVKYALELSSYHLVVDEKSKELDEYNVVLLDRILRPAVLSAVHYAIESTGWWYDEEYKAAHPQPDSPRRNPQPVGGQRTI